MIVWVDGELAPVERARVSPLDHGILTGDGVFETLRVYRGVPFAWRRHLERLEHSASGLGLVAPPDDHLRRATGAVLEANRLLHARLRITLTGGAGALGSERVAERQTVIVAASPLAPVGPSVHVVSVPWPRNERGALSGLKTISYAENVRALAMASAAGAGEAMFLNTRDELCEGTGTNVFLVADGRLLTPPASSGCLLGVTRALVLELAGRLGIPAAEATLSIAELTAADEAFLTSSTREVQAIHRVDDVAMPAVPGLFTARLSRAFAALVAEDLDP
ncbi:MAG: aminotransferase class IV [Acidimicrobiia bacterium]